MGEGGGIILKSGTRGKFKSDRPVYMVNDFGKSNTTYKYIKSVTLCNERNSTLKKSLIVSSKYDSIITKNGDILSGTILAEQFVLKTSYAGLTIKTTDIESINLEGSGRNIKTVQLRTGDRISGVTEDKTVEIKLPIGSELTLEKDKIKLIDFKKSK